MSDYRVSRGDIRSVLSRQVPMITAEPTLGGRMSEIGAWGAPGRVLGTVESMSTGVVAVTANLTTVQCSVCLRTYTDETFWAVKEINFAPDNEESRRGWTKYRRCRSCREAGKHPQK